MYEQGVNRTIRWTLYTAGGLFVLLGILTAAHPMFAMRTLSTIIGVGLIISAANHLIPYLSLRRYSLRPKWLLALGLVDAVYGIIFVTPLGPVFFATFVGLWILFVACARSYMAYLNRAAGAPKWWVTLVCCAAMLIGAMFLLIHPAAWMIIIGAMLVAVGILVIVEGRALYLP